jgi:hypothetical protein
MTKKEVLKICRKCRRDLKPGAKNNVPWMGIEFYATQENIDFFTYLIDELTGKHEKKEYW